MSGVPVLLNFDVLPPLSGDYRARLWSGIAKLISTLAVAGTIVGEPPAIRHVLTDLAIEGVLIGGADVILRDSIL